MRKVQALQRKEQLVLGRNTVELIVLVSVQVSRGPLFRS